MLFFVRNRTVVSVSKSKATDSLTQIECGVSKLTNVYNILYCVHFQLTPK